MTPNLPLGIDATANANAAGLSQQQSDAALVQNAQLQIGSGEIDCGGLPDPSDPNGWIGGLVYCRKGGTGSVFGAPGPLGGGPEFPECCDSDGDGFGTLPTGALHPGATSAQIRTGDLLISRTTTNGVETTTPGTLQYVFATVPALASYSDTAGNSSTVSYPVAKYIPGIAQGGPGTPENGFPVAAGPNGDVVVTFTFWRPQRKRTAGDPGNAEWIDIGGLTYLFDYGAGRSLMCPQSSYSTTDPNLTLPPSGVPGPDMSRQPGGGLSDRARDRAAGPANTLGFTVNLTRCLASRSLSLNPGDTLGLRLVARASNTKPDSSFQAFSIRRT